MVGRVRNGLLVLLFAIMLLPLVQQYVPVITSIPLVGVFHISPDVSISFAKWWDGSYQEEKGKYLNDNISFRADLVRVQCQVNYSLFSKLTTGWGVVGKHNCMLDDSYIHAWNGEDYVGYDTLYAKMVKLKALQDTLARLGKSLVLVHAASEAYYYGECIPDNMVPAKKRPTNFGTCMRLGDSLGVNQLDFNSWFCGMKDTSRDILYSRQGIHWTCYGSMLAADSMIKYIEKIRNINMPHPKWHNIVRTSEPRSTDDDLGKVLNLIWPLAPEVFTYGETVCDTAGNKQRPKAVYIGDSFTWTIADNGVFDCINSDWEFWFYFKTLNRRGDFPRQETPMENYNWQAVLDKTDYVVLLYSAPQLRKLGSGFIEAAYAHYFPAGRTELK